MMYNFLPHTTEDRLNMVKAMGLSSETQLFDDIPASLRQGISYQYLPPEGLSELELQERLKQLAVQNSAGCYSSFLGGGAYHRFIPSAVNTIASRSEFYTAYTPYQPEVSQGTLQVVYEFQTMIAELAGLDVANASVYDGASAVTEAALMAARITKHSKLLVSKTLHPDYRAVLNTYTEALEALSVETFDPLENAVENLIQTWPTEDVAAVIIQHPDFTGCLTEEASFNALRAYCDARGALLIVSSDPVSLGVLEPPGRLGADIVVGDIQPLGNNLSYGGPYGGYMATRQKYLRQLPGRLVGRTLDKNNTVCYTLTLQTREQHIRREKATSNICTNQALNVLKATVYMALVGPQGLCEVATLSMQRAHYLASALSKLPDVSLLSPERAFGFEFALSLPAPAEDCLAWMRARNILGGLSLSAYYPEYPNTLLIATTEVNTDKEITQFIEVFQSWIESLNESGTQKIPGSLKTKETCPS